MDNKLYFLAKFSVYMQQSQNDENFNLKVDYTKKTDSL